MLNRLFIFLTIIGLIAGGVWGFLYFRKVKTPVSQVLDAVPSSAIMILETKKIRDSAEKIRHNNIMWQDLLQTEYFTVLNRQLHFLDSVVQSDSTLHGLLDNKSFVISTHLSGVESYDYLFYLQVPNTWDAMKAEPFVNRFAKDAIKKERLYDGSKIITIEGVSGKAFSYFVSKGLWIGSFSPILVEEAVRQLKSPNTLLKQNDFYKVASTAGSKVDATFYFNYKKFSAFGNLFASANSRNKVKAIGSLASWGAMDVKIKRNIFSLSGFTYANDTANQFLSILKKQSPQKVGLTQVLPASTAYLYFLGLSNFKTYHRDYKSYLENANAIFDYNNRMKAYGNENLETSFYQFIGNEVAHVILEPETEDIQNNSFGIIELSDISLAKEFLGIKADSSDGEDKDGNEKSKEFTIMPFPYSNLLPNLLGEAFITIKGTHFAFLNDYLILGNSESALRNYLHFIQYEKTLDKDDNFKSFSENLSDETNLMVYCNIARSPFLLKRNLSKDISDKLMPHTDLLRKFEAFAIQFSSGKDLFYTNALIKHNPVYKKQNISLWEAQLASSVSSRPRIVENHKTGAKEIIVQDDSNYVYLISNSGKELWRKKLDEKILGDIHQVDSRKNEKLQYVFNTRSSIYMLDRNGDDVKGFPVKLKYDATSPMSVFDYENTRDYRLIVPCVNKEILNFTANGESVEGWNPEDLLDTLVQPLKHFTVGEKDFIASVDVSGNVLVIDRRGKTVAKPKEKIKVSKGTEFFIDQERKLDDCRLIAVDATGIIQIMDLNGNLKKNELKAINKNFLFDYKDLDGDGKREFIFAMDNVVMALKNDRSLLFRTELPNKVGGELLYFKMNGKRNYIGVVSAEASEAYLMDAFGKVQPGFPYYGTTSFSIGDIDKDEVFNLVIGSAEGKLYVYSMSDDTY